MVKRTTPVSQQVVLILEKWIRGGTYDPGDRLPSEDQLAKDLGVSRATVRTALAKLEASGLIIRKHGDGTYVAQSPGSKQALLGAIWQFDHLIEITGRKSTIKVFSEKIRGATENEVEKLRLNPDKQVAEALRLFFADTDPVILSQTIFPCEMFSTEITRVDFSLRIQDILSRYCGQDIAYANAKIEAVLPDDQTQDYLQLEACIAVLKLEDVFYNRVDEQPIALSISYLKSDELDLHQVRPWY